MTTSQEIKTVLSQYINERNNFHRASVVALPANSVTGVVRWDSMLRGHAQELFRYLPALNLAEMEALQELVSVRLSEIRKLT